MKRLNLLVVAILFGAPSAAHAQASAINWDSLTAETVRTLSSYLQINTTNPPGNELAAARWLKTILDREGIEAQILDTAELGANRANLYARLRGNGSKKAIALVHHMDVVPATPASWSVDPFSGVIKDGYIWGRGAIDMKSNGIAQLMAMIALKRSGATLNRDIVFIGNADEELGSLGGITFVQKHPDLLRDVEFLMTEGADNVLDSTGKVVYFGVGVAEKRTFWQRLTVNGVPSHGSRPTPQNPVPKLVTALYKISQWQTPLHVTAGVDKYFRDISRTYPKPQRAWLSNVRVALENPRARSWILSDLMWNAILRNTISLTGLYGSSKTNVIPGQASAEIDIRLLPDQDTTAFREELNRVIGDTAVHLTHLANTKPPLESPIDTDLFRAIERAAHDREPSAFVTTPMETAATDRPTYRKLGIVTYGFSPFKIPRVEIQRGMHGNDERLSVENVGYGLRFYYDILRYVQ